MIGRRSKETQTTAEAAQTRTGSTAVGSSSARADAAGSSAAGSSAGGSAGSSAAGSAPAGQAEQERQRQAQAPTQQHHGARTEGKGRPTPSRRQQEAARVRPLVPEDRKAAKQADRAARREQRLTAQQGMAAGDKRYLPPRDQGEQKAFVRDWVDARWNVAELLMPIALIALIFLLIPSGLQQIGVLVFYALIIVAVLDCVLLVVGVRRGLTRRFGSRESGTSFYAVTRAMNLRSTRMPRPRVKRGERPS